MSGGEHEGSVGGNGGMGLKPGHRLGEDVDDKDAGVIRRDEAGRIGGKNTIKLSGRDWRIAHFDRPKFKNLHHRNRV